MRPTIGFIGIGAMGGPIARNLHKAGYGLVVHDSRKEAVDGLLEAGIEAAASPREVAARSPVVITMLPGSPEVEAAVLGTEGVIEGARPGSTVIDMSSSYPSSTRMVWERLSSKGVRMLDAPVSGGVKGAGEGTLSIMVGGAEEDFKECLPIFQALGRNIYHVGQVGSGHTVKALNNLCSACSMIVTSEALAVAARLGLSPEKVVEVINASSGRSWSSQFKFPTYVLNGAFDSGFSVGLMNKDLEMAVRMGRELHIPMFVGSAVQQLYNHAVGQGSQDECHTAIVKLFENWAGVEIRSGEGEQ